MDALRTVQTTDTTDLDALIAQVAQVAQEAMPVILVAADGTQAVLISAIMHEALIARLENVEDALNEAQEHANE